MKTNGILYTFVKANAISALAICSHAIATQFNNQPGSDPVTTQNCCQTPTATPKDSANFTDFSNTVIDNEGTPGTRNNAGRNDAGIDNLRIAFRPTSFSYPQNTNREVGTDRYSTEQLLLYAKSLKQFAIKFGYDTTYAFFSNMGMLSTKKRFFVVNLTTMEIELTGLVSHGRGEGTIYDKQYSNKAGSKCTALGKYRVSPGRYNGQYGEAYKVHGLEVSNSNAYNRNIVLHSMGCIPDIEGIAPACVTEGCPAVSKKFMSSLQKIIDTRKQSVLLWIFDSNLEEAVVENPAPTPAGPATGASEPPMTWAKNR